MFLFFKNLMAQFIKLRLYYPLFMSHLWMIGAILFYWRNERVNKVLINSPLLCQYATWSVDSFVIIEGDNAGRNTHPCFGVRLS